MNAAKLTLAILLLSSTAALADPEFGRAKGALSFDQIGMMAATGRHGDFANYFHKFASADDQRLVKAMGDTLLLTPRGEKRVVVAQTTWTRGVKKDPRVTPRTVTLVAHIGGGDNDDGLVRPPAGLTAKVDHCRSIWFSYIVDLPLTMDMIQPRLDQQVSDATPYINKRMGEDYSLSVVHLGGCKLAGSKEWAFVWSGPAYGQERWVFMGRYAPSNNTHPSMEIRSIPNHRRSDASKAEGAAKAIPPVNKYDAALLPTPGDSSGMMDIGGSSAPTSAARVSYTVEQARAILMSRPIKKDNVQYRFLSDGTSVSHNAAGEVTGRDVWWLDTSPEGHAVLLTGPKKERWSVENTADLLRRIQQGTDQ